MTIEERAEEKFHTLEHPLETFQKYRRDAYIQGAKDQKEIEKQRVCDFIAFILVDNLRVERDRKPKLLKELLIRYETFKRKEG